jgi:hypothetical protein
MKFIHKLSFIFLILIVNQACKVDEPNLNLDKLLVGTWVYEKIVPQPNANDEYIMVYVRRSKFENQEIGFSFLQSNQVIRRSYYGRCATPPIPIAEFQGRWQLNDKQLNIIASQGDLKGEIVGVKLNYEIVEVTNDTLKLKILP